MLLTFVDGSARRTVVASDHRKASSHSAHHRPHLLPWHLQPLRRLPQLWLLVAAPPLLPPPLPQRQLPALAAPW